MFNQLGNLIINSTKHYVFFYAIGFILGINDCKQLHAIGFVGFILGSIYGFNNPNI
jgi:hypothetical protein